ncbi:MAG: hypothetical protein WCN95_03705 [bacterium]
MYNDNYFLISVIILAFIAGYAIVSFIMNKIKAKKDTEDPMKSRFDQKGPEA